LKVDRHGKNKKQSFTSFEFFRVREKSVPIEGLELKDTVYAFAWEPKGHRFAIVHAENVSAQRFNVSLYSMQNNKLALLKTLEKKQASHLYWSPEGNNIVIAGLRAMNGVLEFYDAANLQSFHSDQHTGCTDVQWDPTGRYVTTFISHWRNKNENGYKIWSFLGREMLTVNKDPFFQFLWRPRPKSLLPCEQLENLSKPAVFKKYEKKYKVQDREKENNKRRNITRVFEQRRAEYKDQQRARMEQWRADSAWRKSIGIPDDRDEDFLVVEECVEEILEEKVELLED